MPKLVADLYARRVSDLPTLRAVHRALLKLGVSAELSASASIPAEARADLRAGPLDCDARVVIAGTGDAAGVESRQLFVIVDQIEPPVVSPRGKKPAEELLQAELILVPGSVHCEGLAPRVEAKVVCCGIARFDDFLASPEGESLRGRAALGFAAGGRLALYAPSADPQDSAVGIIQDGIAGLGTAGAGVAIVRRGWPSSWIEVHRSLAARTPGLALFDEAELTTALAAADVVVSDDTGLLLEAWALGKDAIWVTPPGIPAPAEANAWSTARDAATLEGAVRSASGASSARPRASGQLEIAGSAAQRIAGAIQQRLEPQPDRPAQSEKEIIEAVEARLAFGDAQGALVQLRAQIAVSPSPAAYRVLASIHRYEGELAAAFTAVESGDRVAREALSGVLCERARICVEASREADAQAAFEEAERLAPQLADPSVGLGSLALHAGDPVAAERHFQSALGVEKSSRVWSGLGLALSAQGRTREALTPFESALDAEPDCSSAIYGLVQVAFQTGELRLAERRVRDFVALHAGNLDLLFTLAALRTQLGDCDGALEVIERIELFRPEYPGLEELRAKLGS